MEAPQVACTLKQDAFGRVEHLVGPGGEVVRRVACGGGGPGSGWVARALLRREGRALRALEGIDGVPRVCDRPEWAAVPSADGTVPRVREVLVRSWLPGVPLHAAARLPADYFALLEELVLRLHARRVCHNDLHKEPNILVGPDGRPSVVDFQLASLHPRGGRTFAVRVREDLRHVAKHRRRYFVATGRAPERETDAAGGGRAFSAAAWARLGKPVYNLVVHRLLGTRDGEPRRPPGGPWPVWDPPVGDAERPARS